MTEQVKPEQTAKEHDKFKFEIIYLMPILASMLFGLVCAYILLPQQSSAIPVTPIPEDTPGAPLGNAIYFVILIAISATVFYILLQRRSKRIIKGLIVMAMSAASLLLSLVYLSAIFAHFPKIGISWDYVIIPLSIVVMVLFNVAIFRFGSVARNVAVVGLGGALGVFFGFSVPLWSAILILAFLAVYDVFAVYRGPVGKIAEHGLDQLQGLSFAFKDIQMGLGDLVFYSMLLGAVFFNFSGILPTILAIVGILIGSILTFFMLEKKGIFPGLPFPIMLGLALGLITGFLL
ncbi:MAG: presenilin [Candidatus Bathyarchaeota archaeon]|nr:presenilin [Candidatus Bathyarchaeota archaeon]